MTLWINTETDSAFNATTSSRPRLKILLIDDDPFNLALLEQIFSTDYEIIGVNSGIQALQACSSLIPDLLLLDVVMPDMDGFAVCQQLKADPVLKDIPIIFITGHNDPQSEIQGLELGAVDFISKPINRLVVRARVATHLALKGQTDRLQREINERKRISAELDLYREQLERMVEERTVDLLAAHQKTDAARQE